MALARPLAKKLADPVATKAAIGSKATVVRPPQPPAVQRPGQAGIAGARAPGQYPVQQPPTPPTAPAPRIAVPTSPNINVRPGGNVAPIPAAPPRAPAGFQVPAAIKPHTQPAAQPQITAAPAPAPRPVAPAGSQIQAINPGVNDLRGQQVMPTASPRLAVTQGFTNQAAAGVANAPKPSDEAATLRHALTKELNPRDLRAGAAITPGQDPRLAAAQGRSDQALAGVMSSVPTGTREQQAARSFQSLDQLLRPTDVGFQQGPTGITARSGPANVTAETGPANLRARLGPAEVAAEQGPAGITARTGPSGLQAQSGGTDAVAETFGGRLNPTIVNRALQAETGPSAIQGGAEIAPELSGRLQGLNQTVDSQLGTVTGGQNRQQIAQDLMRAFELENQDRLRTDIQGVGRKAAAFGRLGQGSTEQAVTKTLRDMERDRAAEQLRLAASTAEGMIGDRLNAFNAARGLQGDTFGQEASLRGERRGERDYRTGIERENVGMGREDAAIRTAMAERNLGREREDADIRTRADLTNIGFGREDAAIRTGMGERNLARAREDAMNRQNVAAQNIGWGREDAANLQNVDQLNAGWGREDAANRQALRERNVGRLRDDAANLQNVDLTNIGMGREDAAIRTGMAERNVGRQREDARNLQDVEQLGAGWKRDDAMARMGLAERNVGRGMDARSQALATSRADADAGMGDRWRALDAVGNAEDRAFGQGASLRDELRGERGYRDQFDQFNLANDIESQRYAAAMGMDMAGANQANRFQTLGAAQGLEGQQFGQDTQWRDEVRGERGYADSLARQAQGDRINQRMMEEDLYNQDFTRNMARAEFGYGANPAGMQAAIGDRYGEEAQAANAQAAELMRQRVLQQYLQQQGAR